MSACYLQTWLWVYIVDSLNKNCFGVACMMGVMGRSSAAATKIITEDERVQVVRKMYIDAEEPKHMYKAMRYSHNFTFNYCVQALGRIMEP